MKILLVGGGSGGPVSPLLAVTEKIKLKNPGSKFLLVGTKKGPEKIMAKKAGLPFEYISAGKWRRYFSFVNFLTFFLVVFGFFESIKILRKFKPDCVFGAGSFVQVPLVWAAALLKIPILLHQQDVVPSLANKLCQIFAKKITLTFPSSKSDFVSSWKIFYEKNQNKIVHTGNPISHKMLEFSKQQGMEYFNLHKNLPVLYVVGGGTGAKFINEIILKLLPELSKIVQIIHSTGIGKAQENLKQNYANYHPYEFIEKPGLAYAAADFVLARAGMATISELSACKKVAMIIPMPHSHQEINAKLLKELRAALIFQQEKFIVENFPKVLRRLMFEFEVQKALSQNIGLIMPHNAAEKIAGIIEKISNE